MKKTITWLILIFIITSFAFSQDKTKLSRITINMGQGAFNSGCDFTSIFEGPSNLIEFTANHQRFYAVYFWKLPLKIKAGICAGAFKNMPQTGLYITLSPVECISVFYWRAWGAGEPEKPQFKVNNFFESVGASISVKGLKVSYIWADFLGEKTSLPGICYTFDINSKIKSFVTVDYKVSKKMPLFRIGISYFLGKK